MARSVGSIEVTVDADTSKLRAQLKGAGEKAGKDFADTFEDEASDIDGTELLARLRAIVARAQEQLRDALEANLEFDDTEAVARIKALQARLEANPLEFDIHGDLVESDFLEAVREAQLLVGDVLVDIDTEFDAAEITGDLAEIDALLDSVGVKILPEADQGEFSARLAEIDALLDSVGVELLPEADQATFDQRLAEVDALLASIGVELLPEADQATFEARLAEIDALLGSVGVTVETEVDGAGLVADAAVVNAAFPDIHPNIEPEINTASLGFSIAKANLVAWATGAGTAAGKAAGGGSGGTGGGGGGFGGGFASAIGDQSTLIIGAIVALGDSAAIAVEGAVGGITAVVSSAMEAIGGLAGAALGGIAVVSFAAGASVVGLQGFGDAIGAINDEYERAHTSHYGSDFAAAMGNLAPNALFAAIGFGMIRDALGESRREIQNELFTGLDTTIADLATETLPDVTEALVIAAGKVNLFATNIGDIAADTDFTGLMEALGPSMDAFFRAGEDVVAVIEPFLLAAAPATLLIAAALESGAQSLRDWVEADTGQLEDFFTTGAGTLLLWAGLLGSVSGLLTTIFEAGGGTGNNMVTALDDVITRWDSFLEGPEGQRRLDEFFDDVEQTFDDMEPLFTGLKEAWSVLTEEGAADNFRGTMEALGEILPIIAEALAIMGDLAIVSAIADMLGVFKPWLDLIESMPEGLIAVIGQMIVWTKVIKGLETAMLALKGANPAVLALSAAVALGMTLWNEFTGTEEEVIDITDDLRRSMTGVVDEMVGQADAIDPATAAQEAWGEAIKENEELGTDLANNMVLLNQSMGDSKQVLQDLAGGGDAASETLKQLAIDAGLPAEAATDLAAAVALSNDEWENANDLQGLLEESGGKTYEQLLAIADAAGIDRDRFYDVASAMNELKQSSDDVPFETIARQQLEMASTGTAAETAALDLAIAQQGLSGTAGEVLSTTEQVSDLYDEYIRQLVIAGQTMDQSKAGTDAHTQAMMAFSQAQTAAGMAAEERTDVLRTQRREARLAAQAEMQLAEDTRDAVAAFAGAEFGMDPGAAQGFVELGEAIDETNQAAEDFRSIMDDLFGGFPTYQEAISNAEAAGDDFRNMLDGVAGAAKELTEGEAAPEKLEGWEEKLNDIATSTDVAALQTADLTEAFNLQTEAGRELAGGARDWAADILEIGASGIESGEGIDNVIGKMETMRGELEQSLVDLGFSAEAADEYVNSLLGTPEELSTLIRTPGLFEALLNAEDLTVIYDEMNRPIVTEIDGKGFDLTAEQSEILLGLLDELGITVATPEVSPEGIAPATTEVTDLHEGMMQVASGVWVPVVSTSGIEPAQGAVDTFVDTHEALAGAYVAPTVGTENIDPAVAAAGEVQGALAGVDGGVYIPSIIVGGVDDAVTGVGTVQTDLGEVDGTTAEPDVQLMGHLVMIGLLAVEQTMLNTLNETVADPTLQLTDAPAFTGKILTLGLLLGALDRMVADPDVRLEGYDSTMGNIASVARAVAGLDLMAASPRVSLENYQGTMNQIDSIETNLNSIQDETIRVTTVRTTTGAMAGEMITSPGLRLVGERNYREAIIPLDLPLNRVNPDVREMAALLRSQIATPTLGPASRPQRGGANINQYFTLASADPAAVATQALNRAAAMAG